MAPTPTRERLSEYFRYEPSTGHLIRKQRARSDYKLERNYKIHLSKVGSIAGTINAGGYLKVSVDGFTHSAHRVAWMLHYGEWVDYPKFEIDHINNNTLDNRIENLRKVTKSDNQRNASPRKNNTSGVHGVNWKPKYNLTPGDGRWVARIWDGPRHVYLGSFKNIEDAARVRREAEERLGYTPFEDKSSITKAPVS